MVFVTCVKALEEGFIHETVRTQVADEECDLIFSKLNNKDIIMSGIEIGNLKLDRAIIQGGMGIGVSRSRLAGAVAKEGGMGAISSAQVGYDDPEFRKDPEETNLKVLPLEIKKAKAISGGNGVVAVNIMSVTQLYGRYEKTVILKTWDKKYGRSADFIVMESPYSGGHRGYKKEQLADLETTAAEFDDEVKKVISLKQEYEEKYNKRILLFIGGGIFTAQDKEHYIELGADGVQLGTRFIATEECDASETYKQAFIRAKAKYCISQALINAVKGDVENGLIFCSAKVEQIQKIQTVKEVMDELEV